ncbi:MAG: glycosyltransferase [Anaerolineae bacterium]|nr:glycosyltransferase [Anaerolineae bacterium]
MEPLVSIITPSFNQAWYIQATIDSVLTQDYPALEYLIVDGGSTDGTVDILRQCTDPRMKWVSEPDRGQSDAINKGLKWATGEFIAYINSDDLLLPGAVSATLEEFRQHPDYALVYGDCIHIRSDGSQIAENYYGAEAFDLEQVLMGRVFIPQQTVFWRRTVTESIGAFDETLHYLMDVDYWLRAVAAGFRLLYVPGIRAAYRLHDSSKTVSQVEHFWSDWDAMIDKFFALPNLPPEIARLKPITRKTYWRMYTLRAAWLQGGRAELRPLLGRLIGGAVPNSHRVLASLMLLDTYLHTSLSDRALEQLQRAKSSANARAQSSTK